MQAKSLSKTSVEIRDIRTSINDNPVEALKQEIVSKMSVESLRSIPTLILYDDNGLELFDKITYLEEYYLTNAEINVFQRYADKLVANYIQDGSTLVELGVGSMRKTKYLLDSIVRHQKAVTYYALDLSEKSLKESLEPLSQHYPSISFVGLLGTYEDSLQYIKQNIPSNGIPRMFLWLGSSIGNFTRQEASAFCKKVCEEGLDEGDLFAIGIDRRNDPQKVHLAYCDPQKITENFIMNGLVHVNHIFGCNIFDLKQFEYVSIYNEDKGRHEAYYRSICNQTLLFPTTKINLKQGELIHVEYSYKYSQQEVDVLLNEAKLMTIGRFSDSNQLYDIHLVQKPPFHFDKTKHQFTLPTKEDFEQVFKAWNTIQTMIFDFNEKPISLRHPFIFYLGHLPAFLDIQLSRCLDLEPISHYFNQIFERGIDPDVNDSTKCHVHSIVPNQWPSVDEIRDYEKQVLDRFRLILKGPMTVRLARVLHMAFEHYSMHMETLLYMIIQSDSLQKPKMIHQPIFNERQLPIPPCHFIDIPAECFEFGIDDDEDLDDENDLSEICQFGWDNEKPKRMVKVDSFKIQNRPVSIGEYFEFLAGLDSVDASYLPATWSFKKQNFQVLKLIDFQLKTSFGRIPLSHCLWMPVFVSNEQASRYALEKNMRLPTELELAAVRRKVKSNNLNNFGFASFMPKEMNIADNELVFGGDGWEHTSTVFDHHQGFKHSELYPAYSADFFDGKHNVVVGCSWATHHSLNRPSFRNWYQVNYPFVFATFRLVLDE